MKGKISFSLIIIALFFIVDYLSFKANTYFGTGMTISVLYFFIVSLLIFLFILNLCYKALFTFKSGKGKIALYTILPLLLSMHLAGRLLAVNTGYFYSKNLSKKTSGNIWKPDPLLAHKGIPNAKGTYDYFIGDSIKGSVPVLLDELGYRTVPDSLKVNSDTCDLYLGCSFTFGDYIKAEDGYPYVTSKLLHHTFRNAGASAYGFAQMKQIADNLLPKYKFKYVFIQLSPWLADRAMSLNGPAFRGARPFPYFSDKGNTFILNKPAFEISKTQPGFWRNTPASYKEKISFEISDGWKSEIAGYYSSKWAGLQTFAGIKARPTNKKKELEKYFYDYMIAACRANNCIPVILKLKYPAQECSDLLGYLDKKATVIDLDADLDKKVMETGKTYSELFGLHYISNNQSILFDEHPNEFANELFSKRIFNQLNFNPLLLSKAN